MIQLFSNLWRLIMYRLVKLFDKSILAADEKIVTFHFKSDGTIFGVETNLSFYMLERVT